MVDGQTAATLGVGIGVVLVVLEQVTPGMVFMLLGIGAFIVLEAGGSDDRGRP